MTAPSPSEAGYQPGKWPKLDAMDESMLKALAEFIHDENKNAATRTAAVSTLLFSLWQNSGRRMTHRMPSLLLINSDEEEETSQLDAIAANLVNIKEFQPPQVHKKGYFPHGTPKQAPDTMECAIHLMAKCQSQNPGTYRQPGEDPLVLKEWFYAAQKTGFGDGRARPYKLAWNDKFGLITQEDCEVIMRLTEDDDRAAFRQQVMREPKKLQAARGYGPNLTPISKHFCVSGSLKISEWDGEFTKRTLGLGLPFVFLPEPVLRNRFAPIHPAIECMTSILREAFAAPLEEPVNILPEPWFAHYGELLRNKLRSLPAEYEYLMQRMARQLYPVSLRLAQQAGRFPKASGKESEAVAMDLCAHALRGLVISIAGLSWHGFGLSGDIAREEAVHVLEHIRKNGPMSRSDVARGNRISKETRDMLLNCFAEADLVKIDGKVVTATNYAEFVEALYARKEFPEPPIHWKTSGAKVPA